MAWQNVSFLTDASHAEPMCDVLLDVGALSASIEDADAAERRGRDLADLLLGRRGDDPGRGFAFTQLLLEWFSGRKKNAAVIAGSFAANVASSRSGCSRPCTDSSRYSAPAVARACARPRPAQMPNAIAGADRGLAPLLWQPRAVSALPAARPPSQVRRVQEVGAAACMAQPCTAS